MPMRSHVSTASRGVANDLILLAAEKSSAKRLELLRRLTDVYLKRKVKGSPAAEYLFNDLVTELLDKIGTADRAEASAQLSTQPDIPGFLAHRLATDADIAVAAPMVRNYQGLSEHTLLTVAKTGSQQHLRHVAGRAVVTPPVTEIVVNRGNQKTVRTLAANHGAQFFRTGMRRLIEKSAKDLDLRALIVERADLTLEAVGTLLPLVSHELAARLHLRSAEISEAAISPYFEEWMKRRSKNIAQNEAYIEGIRTGNLTLENVALEMIKAKRLLDAATVLAEMNDLEADYAFDLLSRGSVDAVLLLMRSMELSWPVVDGFLQLRRAKMTPQRHEQPAEPAGYESIDLATAQRVVRFMKVQYAAMTQSAPASSIQNRS